MNLSDASDALFDAELCGNVRGAFTGATEDKPGYLGLAEGGGTLVFDELGDIGGAIQGSSAAGPPTRGGRVEKQPAAGGWLGGGETASPKMS